VRNKEIYSKLKNRTKLFCWKIFTDNRLHQPKNIGNYLNFPIIKILLLNLMDYVLMGLHGHAESQCAESQCTECKCVEFQRAEPNVKVPNVPRCKMYQSAEFTNVPNVNVPNV
jgi:hypothetical protein